MQKRANSGVARPAGRARRLMLVVGAAMLAASLTLVGDVLFQGGGPAWAVVGRPLTPVSYAGVARRTTRRTVARTSYGYGGAYPYPGTVTALPAGCAGSGGYYQCGAASYRPYYDGPNLVYVPY